MSTEGRPAPRTRAEARAAREAAEAASVEAATTAQSEQPAPVAQPVQPAVPAIPLAPELVLAAVPPFVEDPPAAPKKPGDRRFLASLLAVVGVLAVVVTGLGAVSLFQGPRISEVQVDTAEAMQVSGSRVILTLNQAVEPIAAEQVTVEPAVPFTVDATGRSIGIRFTVPLDDETDYTVTVADATGIGGGPSADLRTEFTTPASQVFLLNRTDDDDQIFRTDLAGEARPVFTHPRINDYRATSTHLIVAVEDEDGSRILVMNLSGEDERELALPGDGYVSAVQVSERGGLVGYTYSDREISEESGRASVLVTQSISGGDEPRIIEVGGAEASIAEWQFVPDSTAVLFIDFEGTLSLDDRSGDAGAQPLGLAMRLLGVSRGTYTAIVERIDGSVVELNLADGSEVPLAASEPDYGAATTITPFPGGTLRHVVARDEVGLPTGQAIIRVDDEGQATPLLEVGAGNAILQACASPSGQYAAVTVAPDLAGNTYDDMLVPLPKRLETHLLDLRSGEELVALTGF
ncbi:Ig-like domain-containing protein, partial [uncultured Microbacterium sp.]|uniref:Ig-like domain-containing protein n=1 Tax=uncultured Microbacterium sp. TaxID=191216 RepID=UPI0026354293